MNLKPIILGAMLFGSQVLVAQDASTPTDSKPKARIAGGVMAGQIVTKVQPRYPAAARANHISGTVVMHAIIGRDGAIANLTVISGPEELRDAATDAVSQWTYKPYLLNGLPTEVDTTITVNFNFGPVPPPPSVTGMAASMPTPADFAADGAVRVSGGVMQARIVSNPAPVYPPIARAAHVSGAVVMHALIGADGTVKNLQAISGPEMLRGSALLAVSHWRWQPYSLNGEPVPVDTTVTVNFSFADSNGTGSSGDGALNSAPQNSAVAGSPGKPMRVASGVMAALAVDKPEPICSPEHKGDSATGTVVLDAIISRDGRVANLNVISGPEWMRGCVLDAVSQWTYKPFLMNDVPEEVETTITISLSAPELPEFQRRSLPDR